MDKERVNVLCMKWGTKYPAEYVNRLYSMVKRNLCRPFRFACLTDDPDGLESQICHYPLPTLKAELSGPERGWNKLGVFSEQLYDLQGQVLCLDLDLIITGKLDDFFDYFGDVVIIRDWVKRDGTGNSSVYRFEIGSHPDILNEFETKYEDIKKVYRNEQEYLSARLIGKKALSYWPDSWCRSFKRHCVKPFSFITSRETAVPHDARFIIFHGKPDPHNAVVGESGKWYRKFEPATWIKEYWY